MLKRDNGLRRSFSSVFIVADAPHRILGADFHERFKLSLCFRRRCLIDDSTGLSVTGNTIACWIQCLFNLACPNPLHWTLTTITQPHEPHPPPWFAITSLQCYHRFDLTKKLIAQTEVGHKKFVLIAGLNRGNLQRNSILKCIRSWFDDDIAHRSGQHFLKLSQRTMLNCRININIANAKR